MLGVDLPRCTKCFIRSNLKREFSIEGSRLNKVNSAAELSLEVNSDSAYRHSRLAKLTCLLKRSEMKKDISG